MVPASLSFTEGRVQCLSHRERKTIEQGTLVRETGIKALKVLNPHTSITDQPMVLLVKEILMKLEDLPQI